MDLFYEIIQKDDNLPVKAFIHSVDKFETHWHKELEILICLEGSVKVNKKDDIYILKKDQFIIINKNEPHSIRKTNEGNALLAVQIDSYYINNIYPEFDSMFFKFNELDLLEEKKENILIKRSLAKIIIETSQKSPGYELRVTSEVYLLASYIISFYDYKIMDNKKIMDDERNRIKRVISYIEMNALKNASLGEIAKIEGITIHHLSRIFKDNVGINFHDYLVSIRISEAKDLLLYTDRSITDIAFKSGFPSTKSLNRYFKKEFNETPSSFRKTFESSKKTRKTSPKFKKNKTGSYLEIDRNALLSVISSYIDDAEESKIGNYSSNVAISKKVDIKKIDFDLSEKGEKLKPYWENLITLPRAYDGLRSSVKEQLVSLSDDMNFNYIRFHGIFSDEMMIFNLDKYGDPEYNWTYLDEIFDFFLSINIKPFIELGFMPSEIKSSDDTVFSWKANISMPKDIRLWNDLVKNLVNHLINRYGLKEVRTWYFEVWNEPELEGLFWSGTRKDYFEFYRNTHMMIKSIDKKLKVGGPSVTHEAVLKDSWLKDFLGYINGMNLKLDFISIHIYPEVYTSMQDIERIVTELKKGKDETYMLHNWQSIEKIYHGKDNVKRTLTDLNAVSEEKLGYLPEIHVTEWNASAYVRNFIHDTSFVATYILYNVIQNIGEVNSLGYWTLTDLIEENKVGISHFHGGFGLINKDGIKKPGYFAYYFLNKLGGELLSKGKDYIITKEKDEIQIIIFNFTYFNDLFLQGETSFLTNEKRYDVYSHKNDILFDISLNDLKGNYKISKYRLDRENGSAFDEWKKMGFPENMSREEIKYLKYRSFPDLKVSYEYLNGDFSLKERVSPHGAMLITLKKIYN